MHLGPYMAFGAKATCFEEQGRVHKPRSDVRGHQATTGSRARSLVGAGKRFPAASRVKSGSGWEVLCTLCSPHTHPCFCYAQMSVCDFEEWTVMTNHDACISKSLNKAEQGERSGVWTRVAVRWGRAGQAPPMSPRPAGGPQPSASKSFCVGDSGSVSGGRC